MSRSVALLLLTVLVLSSFVMVGCAFAESIPKPSVPEFTSKLADHSYDVPKRTTSTTDPYTGKTTTHTYPAYHVQNLTIDIIFRNQDFPSTINGYPTVLYYDIAIKPHFIEDWYGPYDKGWFPAQLDSEFTTISFPRSEYPDEAQLDFRAQAYLGYHYNYTDYSLMYPIPQTQSSFSSSASDWSETQTIRIGESQISSPEPTIPTSPSPFPTDYTGVRLSETEIIIGASIIVAIVIVVLGLLLYLIKRK